ncbi:heat shock protein Hsp20 [Alicycliphilus sp. B1]|nr:heat shock protein Hsp20 [Alicycliphilus sp. B1]
MPPTPVQAEVPGVPKEDINVSIDGNVVSLRAEVRQHDEKKDGEKVLRSERYYRRRGAQLPAARGRGCRPGQGQVRQRRAHAHAAQETGQQDASGLAIE